MKTIKTKEDVQVWLEEKAIEHDYYINNDLSVDTPILNINHHALQAIPIKLGKIVQINLDNNLLINLPSLPKDLEQLSVLYNKLIHLPELPPNLTMLLCSHNSLTHLPKLPKQLVYLKASNQNLNTLPELPKHLKVLSVTKNQLTELPILPELKILHCAQNPLKELPLLPNSLKELSLPLSLALNLHQLPPNLKKLDISDDNLKTLPATQLLHLIHLIMKSKTLEQIIVYDKKSNVKKPLFTQNAKEEYFHPLIIQYEKEILDKKLTDNTNNTKIKV
jgi:Leucine-rich repeat (LRR) protein